MTAEQPLIDVRGVSFAYAENMPPALRDATFSIRSGEFVAFVGQNGAGKTTCAKLLNGVLRPTSGQVLLDGRDSQSVSSSELARTVGYCYQNPDHQIWALKVEEELSFGPSNVGLEPDAVRAQVSEVVDLVGLRVAMDAYTFSLGWGERQKLAVASILAMKPRIIIVDEPTTGLDWDGSRRIMDLLTDLNRQGLTVIIVTHDMSIVAEYTQRCVVFSSGSIIRDGRADEVLYDAAALDAADLRQPQFIRVAQALGLDTANQRYLHPGDVRSAIHALIVEAARERE